MLRKLLILGVCAGTSASVPVLYQGNSDVVHRWLRSAATKEPSQPEISASSVAPHPNPSSLTGRKVAIPVDGRGHFLADFKVNGRRVQAMVDTGATLVALNQSTARSLGITLAAADFHYHVDTANGSARAASVTIPAIDIGRIHVEKVAAVVLEDGALRNVLIGMSFLSRLERYQVENGAMLLVQ